MNGTQLEIKYGSKIINSDNCNEFMLVIADQNSRNIIQGKTNEFILGENIQLQYELKDKIDSQANSLWRECKQVLEKYAINKKSSPLIGYFRQSHRDSIEKIANRRSTPGPIEDIKKTIEYIGLNRLGNYLFKYKHIDDVIFDYISCIKAL